MKAFLFVLDAQKCQCAKMRREVAKRPAANWLHGCFSPSDGLPEPPSLPATDWLPFELWLDGSTIVLFVGYGAIGSHPIFWVGKKSLTTFHRFSACRQVLAYRCTRLCSSQSQRGSIWRMGIHFSRNIPILATQGKWDESFASHPIVLIYLYFWTLF